MIFLTVLIWVWADLAQDREWPVPKLAISVAKSADPALWVSFKGEDGSPASSVSITNIVLKGPASKIADVERMWNRGSLDLEVFLVPEQQGMTEPGDHPRGVLSFLKQSDKIRQLGLTVESCEPNTLVVQVVKLVEQKVAVECLNESGIAQKAEIKPEKVDAFVPADRTITAKVRLTPSEIKHARSAAIKKTPYVEMPDGQIMEVSTNVEITMPPAEDVLRNYTVKAPKLIFALSPTLQDKYKVEVTNWNEVIRGFTIRATPEAGRAYESQPFHMILCILDDDEKPDEQSKPVIYYLPDDFVRRGEIEVPEPPAEARFKLVPRSGEVTASEGH